MANKIKARREQLGLTQKQVADKVGIAESQYQGYENGRHMPTVQLAIKIAQILNTTVEKLFIFDDK